MRYYLQSSSKRTRNWSRRATQWASSLTTTGIPTTAATSGATSRLATSTSGEARRTPSISTFSTLRVVSTTRCVGYARSMEQLLTPCRLALGGCSGPQHRRCTIRQKGADPLLRGHWCVVLYPYASYTADTSFYRLQAQPLPTLPARQPSQEGQVLVQPEGELRLRVVLVHKPVRQAFLNHLVPCLRDRWDNSLSAPSVFIVRLCLTHY